MKEHYENLKKTYDEFERFLLKNGQLLSKDTEIGYWGVTPLKDLATLFTNMKLKKHKHLLDLGSGDGRVVLLASLFGVKATGIEFDPWLTNVALDVKNKLDIPHFENVTLLKKDFNDHDISKYDVVYVSPDQPFHRGLETKLRNELKGRLIVHGHEFLPAGLKKEKDFSIDGEMFTLYTQ